MPPGISSAHGPYFAFACHFDSGSLLFALCFLCTGGRRRLQMTMKRITREIADLKKEDLGPMSLEPVEGNLSMWKGRIPGPQGSVYEGGVFDVEIVLPADYPFSAPKVVFKTRIYHMNISESGNICIDILKQNWSPALSLFKVMLSLSSLLTDPNPRDPLVPSIATQYVRNRKQHDDTARQWTASFATPKPPPPVITIPSDDNVPVPASARAASNRAKGKKRADAGPPDGNAAAGSSRAGGSHTSTPAAELEVIDISDEDGGAAAASSKGKGKKRKRGEGATNGIVPGEVVDLVDSDDEGASGAGGASEGGAPPPKRTRATARKAGPGRSSLGSGSGSARTNDEVIVIEDDDEVSGFGLRMSSTTNSAPAALGTTANVFPVSLYEDLLPKLVAILKLTQQTEGISNPQAKQALLQATNNFKNAVAQAKEFAVTLPGGELRIDEQEDVIQMLETLKERKRAQLAEFAARKIASSSSSAYDSKMEIDSVASTPAQSDG
ncbi:hypothetical protein CVT26_008243 [Gymnopilus dilepis]|uniref:E2 ubiquitin-conjugating enzyme n=1 Tax=Gymnopilus dilepis TaxID=231916 RepID=A0A409XX99_9AGAR|nr:hypothetical protein CVT26_008243 [Gymnopilus dilepis]